MKNAKGTMIVAVLAGLATGSAQAGLINSGFETGDLTGWSVNAGNAAVVSSHSAYLPQEGSFFLKIQAGSANVWQTVTQSVTLAAGQLLEGSAAFDWGDYSPYMDGARVRILGVTGGELAVPYFQDGAGDTNYADLPWTDWSWAAPSAGTYIVEFGSVNTLDSANSGYGLFDLKQTTVPEPASLALLGIGLAGLGAMRRRKTA